MPIYEYECAKCSKVEEIFQKFSDKPLTKCQHCGGKLHKLISQSSFHLKGTGWYVTDYAKKSKTNSSAAKKSNKEKRSQTAQSSSSSKESKASRENSAT
ncbi:MAG: zinc ribbon domain-containing protein [Desulfobacterales bacterium]|nr:zinc ribbon domain-containing protein [Desulfobacterales bacterium]